MATISGWSGRRGSRERFPSAFLFDIDVVKITRRDLGEQPYFASKALKILVVSAADLPAQGHLAANPERHPIEFAPLGGSEL
jgi:hypothetical protein